MATSQKQNDWAKTAIRLPRELHQRVHEVARREDRSFNGQIVTLIRDGLRMRQQDVKPMMSPHPILSDPN